MPGFFDGGLQLRSSTLHALPLPQDSLITWTPLPSPPHSLRMPSSPPMGTHRIRCTSSVNPGSAMFWLLDMHIWLISLNMMISRSTHLPANVMISFFFICSSPDVHLDYVPFPGYCDKCSTNHG
ncbi:mCG1039127 [Mus musculus]|nr:mCG1039127 [Mus musculus]